MSMSYTEKQRHKDNRPHGRKQEKRSKGHTLNSKHGNVEFESEKMRDDRRNEDRKKSHTCSPPVQLPRLESPTIHNRLQRRSRLRGSKYNIVPPLGTDHEDRWGEEMDGDEGAHRVPNDFPYTSANDGKSPGTQASDYLKQHNLFAHNYIENFIVDFLQSDMIPNLLISILSKPEEDLQIIKPTHKQTGTSKNDILQKQIKIAAAEVEKQTITECNLERLINDQLIEREVSFQCTEIVAEMIQSCESKQRCAGVAMLEDYADRKLLDSLCLEHLLDSLPKEPAKDEHGDLADQLVDGSTLSILLDQHNLVAQGRAETTENTLLKRLHEKIVADLIMDQLLGELCRSLQEDMADLDEYEQGLTTHKRLTQANS